MKSTERRNFPAKAAAGKTHPNIETPRNLESPKTGAQAETVPDSALNAHGIMNTMLSAIEETFPLPGRFRSKLPAGIAELSRLLTGARNEREGGYLNRPDLLAAYLRYFVPWNVFRLLKLFAMTGCPRAFTDGDAVSDLGSGPLTVPAALWLAFPGLRGTEIEFRCIDKSAAALDAGKRLFAALCRLTGHGKDACAWKIKTIHDSLEAPVRGKKAALVTAVNVLNETYPRGMTGNAGKAAALLCARCDEQGSVLVVEPGNPQGGACVAALRAAFLERGRFPAAPCTHEGACPAPGPGAKAGKSGTKWCHFAFDTDAVPEALHRLSASAGIPKERAVFSFILAGPAAGNARAEAGTEAAPVRVLSDPFAVPSISLWGRYGCSRQGMVLLAGTKNALEAAAAGTRVELPFPPHPPRDSRTGFPVLYL